MAIRGSVTATNPVARRNAESRRRRTTRPLASRRRSSLGGARPDPCRARRLERRFRVRSACGVASDSRRSGRRPSRSSSPTEDRSERGAPRRAPTRTARAQNRGSSRVRSRSPSGSDGSDSARIAGTERAPRTTPLRKGSYRGRLPKLRSFAERIGVPAPREHSRGPRGLGPHGAAVQVLAQSCRAPHTARTRAEPAHRRGEGRNRNELARGAACLGRRSFTPLCAHVGAPMLGSRRARAAPARGARRG